MAPNPRFYIDANGFRISKRRVNAKTIPANLRTPDNLILDSDWPNTARVHSVIRLRSLTLRGGIIVGYSMLDAPPYAELIIKEKNVDTLLDIELWRGQGTILGVNPQPYDYVSQVHGISNVYRDRLFLQNFSEKDNKLRDFIVVVIKE